MRTTAVTAIVLAVLLVSCAGGGSRDLTDEEILATLPPQGSGDWPALKAALVASERNRAARAEAAKPEEEVPEEGGILGEIDSWSPGIESGSATSHDMFQVQDSPHGGDDEKTGEFLIVPVPFANPTIGAGLFVLAGTIFRPNPDDKVSPPSTLGGGGMYSTNNSWGLGLGGSMFLDEDRWRIGAALAYADVNYRLYGVGQEFGGVGKSVRISQQVLMLQASVLYGLGGNFHIGPVFRMFRVETELNDGRPIKVGPIDIPVDPRRARQVSLGAQFTFDTRDDVFYPREGQFVDAQARFYREALGGRNDYEIYSLAANTYHSMAERTVLAGRLFWRMADGQVPFYGLSYLGTGPDIRGYEVGRYQDKILIAVQAEIRQELLKNFGVEAFAGFGQVQREMNNFRFSDFLPGIGAGVTYDVAADSTVNMRADVAWGVDGWVFYLGVGQAF